MVQRLVKKPDWLILNTEHHSRDHQPAVYQQQSDMSISGSSSIYENPKNREDLFLPLPHHILSFIDEREKSNPKRYKRYKCCMCKRNTHHRCLKCAKAFCKECAFKKHISMNPNYAKDSYSYQ